METVDTAFLKVPVELLSQSFRNTQKLVTRELNTTTKEIYNLVEAAHQKKTSVNAASEKLQELEARLSQLEDQVKKSDQLEEEYIETCTKRIKTIPEPENSKLSRGWWIDRAVGTHLLERGWFEAAHIFEEELGLQALLDTEVYLKAKEVEDNLHNHCCQKLQEWCTTNSSKLRRLDSSLEFHLKKREFLELVRSDQKEQALAYAREHFEAHAKAHSTEIQTAMATLAFSDPATCDVPEIKALFNDDCWKKLIEEFDEDNRRIFGMTKPSPLNITVQAGLAALKTPSCFANESPSCQCPVCDPAGQVLASGLPFSHRSQSILICRISGSMMNENNPPMMLPNGHIYSKNALDEMAKRCDGKLTCPITGDSFSSEEPRNVYII